MIRSGNLITIEDNYFDSLVNTNSNNEYKTIAKKKISANSLSEFESVSLSDNDYLITYEVSYNLEESEVTLNVYFDNSKEVIIENFKGIQMTNYNNILDILFLIDNEHIFLSELNSLNDTEQCSWFGNVLHKVINNNLKALSYIEPAIKLLNYVNENIIDILYNSFKNTSYITNYNLNLKLNNPDSFVYGQSSYNNFHFGFSNLSYAGCEVIAGYNLAYAKGLNYSLADTVFLYETLGIEIGTAQGFFGANPYQISYFFNAIGISYNKVTSYKTFEKYMNDVNNYYVILSRWNGENSNDQIHTFLIDKDSNSYYKYKAYNYKVNNKYSTTNYNNFTKFFEKSISNTYICAYFIKK